MQLLVSVSDGAEASAALAGGADIIDAKDPAAGVLGAVSSRVLREICAIVGGSRPVTAAIGDAADEGAVERLVHEFASAGVTLVKVGFAGIESASRIASLIEAAVGGASAATNGRCGVVAVAYADPGCDCGISVPRLMNTAARAGARGVLVDTNDKSGPRLCQLAAPLTLARWAAEAHDLGLTIALAGKLTADDLHVVREAGADIAGVRGAACENGRAGRVSADSVRKLAAKRLAVFSAS